MNHVQQKFHVSERHACRAVGQHRSVQRRKPVACDGETKLVRRILELVRIHPRFGYRRICRLLRREYPLVNAKRVYRLWRQEGLKVPRRVRKKRGHGSSKNACYIQRSRGKDDVWAWDFVFDYTANGTQLKWLTIVDEFTRECVALNVSRSITADDVIDALCALFAVRGVPNFIRSDNGPEFIAKSIKTWMSQVGVSALHIEPGSPWENGYSESFNSKLRDEFLNMREFESIRDARELTAQFRRLYNEVRPHSALQYQTPAEFAAEQPSARARQTGTAPTTFTITSATGRP